MARSPDKTITLYHAGDTIKRTEDIIFPGPRDNCDFGRGIYLAEQAHTAEEWVLEVNNPIINVYRLDLSETRVLRLIDREWVKVIFGFRRKNYTITLKSRIIIGPIANDRMFDSFRLFASGAIGDYRLIKALDYCKFGNQYAIREPVAGLTWIRAYPLDDYMIQQAKER